MSVRHDIKDLPTTGRAYLLNYRLHRVNSICSTPPEVLARVMTDSFAFFIFVVVVVVGGGGGSGGGGGGGGGVLGVQYNRVKTKQ